ncbi:MAG: hypothetical protein HYY13_08485 [Nitrospirae bacterium]|nr:hypothetical protein [Nitrospirota bacterium]
MGIADYNQELYRGVDWEEIRAGNPIAVARLEGNARRIVADRVDMIEKSKAEGQALSDEHFRSLCFDKLAAEISLSMIESWKRGMRGEDIGPSPEVKAEILKLAAELGFPMTGLPGFLQKAANKLMA